MEGGEIIVNGNSDYGLGWGMKNGAITVNGDAARQAGFGMEGGRITIRGNGGEFIGDSMKGGEIHLFQEDPDVASILGGKIFLEGKLIAEK
jgi:formylmethanofuran dehydrogenase subunit C